MSLLEQINNHGVITLMKAMSNQSHLGYYLIIEYLIVKEKKGKFLT